MKAERSSHEWNEIHPLTKITVKLYYCENFHLFEKWAKNISVFFFPRDIFWFARDIFRKSTRDLGKVPVAFFEKVPVTKSEKKCPWQISKIKRFYYFRV